MSDHPMFLASAVEAQLLVVLLQLGVIILAARAFGTLFRRLGQPAVVGEIAAGLALGPSVLGKLEGTGWFQTFSAEYLSGATISGTLFDPSVNDVFQVLSQLGLVFLLFLIGLEFDFRHLRVHSRSALYISLTGVALPFGTGFWLGHAIHGELGLTTDARGFALFLGTAMSITAIPILGRIMMELNIARTALGAVTITSAAIDDAVGWILLATVSAMVRTGFDGWATARMVGLTVAFTAGVLYVVRPALVWWIGRSERRAEEAFGLNFWAVLFAVLFACAMATSRIGIFAIFGAFLLGAALSDQAAFRAAAARQLRTFVTVFFLPIFFTYTGLRTDVGTLGTWELWLMAGAVSAVAVAGKFGGCAAAARLGGFGWRESACIGVMMNTRALMELIVINVGYDLGIIPASVFCMLVLMALLTTVMTTPILLWMIRGTELEPLVAESGFGRGRDAEAVAVAPEPVRSITD